MTYPINVNIPAAANDPADDQPEMKTNFSNINSYLQVDHTNPAATGAGQHKQVTFNSNNVPSIPTSPPVLFTNTQDGAGNTLPGSVPELFFYSGDATRTSNQYRSVAVGSTVLTGGIIMKWGAVAAVSDGTPISFVTPFPNNVFSLQVSGGTSSSPQPTINFSQSSLTTSGFTAKITGTQPLNLYYIAIGN